MILFSIVSCEINRICVLSYGYADCPYDVFGPSVDKEECNVYKRHYFRPYEPIIIHFTESMNRESVEEAFELWYGDENITESTTYEFIWDEEPENDLEKDKRLEYRRNETAPLTQWEWYKVKISGTAKDIGNVHMKDSVEMWFRTDLDLSMAGLISPEIELLIRTIYNIGTEPVWASHMVDLNVIEAVSAAITNITGIEYALNLRVLNLSRNTIGDISLLGELKWLNELNLSNNAISDLTPLLNLHNSGGLQNGSYLNIENNGMDIQSGTNNYDIVMLLISRGVEVYYVAGNNI